MKKTTKYPRRLTAVLRDLSACDNWKNYVGMSLMTAWWRATFIDMTWGINRVGHAVAKNDAYDAGYLRGYLVALMNVNVADPTVEAPLATRYLTEAERVNCLRRRHVAQLVKRLLNVR